MTRQAKLRARQHTPLWPQQEGKPIYEHLGHTSSELNKMHAPLADPKPSGESTKDQKAVDYHGLKMERASSWVGYGTFCWGGGRILWIRSDQPAAEARKAEGASWAAL